MDLKEKKNLLFEILQRKQEEQKEKKFWEEDRWKGKLDPGITLKMPTPVTKQQEYEKTGLKALLNKSIDTPAYNKMVGLGIVPEVKDKSIVGQFAARATFPLKKLYEGLMAFPRAESTMGTEQIRQIGADEARKYGFLYQEPLKDSYEAKDLIDFVKPKFQDLKSPTDYGKIFSEGAKAFLNAPSSQYKDWSWAKEIKEREPEKAINYEWAKDTDDWIKGTNWFQKFAAGITGSQADIEGLILDVGTDLITYITGGVGTGTNTGVKASKKILSETGEVIFKKGSPITLKSGAMTILKSSYDDALKQADEAYKFIKSVKNITGKNVKLTAKTTSKLVKAFKKLGIDISRANTYDDILRWTNTISDVPEKGVEGIIRKKVTEGLVRDMFKKMTTEQAKGLVDYGGIKWFGETVIPGYKFQPLEKVMKSMQGKPVIGRLSRLFSTRTGWADEFIPVKEYIESAGRYRAVQGADLLDDILKGKTKGIFGQTKLKRLGKESIQKIDDYLGYSYDISKAKQALAQAKDNKIIGELTKRIDDLGELLPKLNGDELLAMNRYKTEFLDDFLRNTELAWGSNYTPLESYYISRTTPVGEDVATGWARGMLGPEKAPYQHQKALTYTELKELAKQGRFDIKTLPEASLQRIAESATAVSRKQMLNEAKGFGSLTKQPGYVESTLPELKGWYFPEEIVKPFERVEKAFFGDEGIKLVTKLYDKVHAIWKRWALATPGFHMRNLYSDGWSGWIEWGMDYFNPKNWINAVKVKANKHVLIDVGEYGRVYADDLAREMSKSGEMAGGFYAKEAMTQTTGKKIISKIDPSVWSTKVGGVREDMGRIVGGLIERSKGSNNMMAALNVKKVFYDYSDLTKTEKNLLKRVFPFYTWTRKNLPRQLELMISRAGKYSAIGKVKKYFDNITEGDPAREGYDLYKEDWRKELQVWPTNWKTEEGQPLDLWPNLPFGDVEKFDVSGSGLSNTFMEMLTPLMKAPIEQITDRNLFYGSELNLEGTQDAPKWLKNTLGKLPNSILEQIGMAKDEESGNVVMTNRASHVLRQFPLFANLSRVIPPTELPNTPYNILSMTGGIKLFPYDKEKAKTNYQNLFINEYKDTATNQARLTGIPTLGLTEIKSGMKFMYEQAIEKKYSEQIQEAESLKLLGESTGGDKGKSLKDLAKKQLVEYEKELSLIKNMETPKLYELLLGMGIEPTRESIWQALDYKKKLQNK